MRTVRTIHDGEKVVVPEEVRHARPGEVILVFADADDQASDSEAWSAAQEAAFTKVWDNDDDSIYDKV